MEVLKNKSYRSYDYISRYQQFPYYFHSEDNRYTYGTTALLKLSLGYSVHIVKLGDTLDSLALNYYNSPTLFWVICDFNKIQDPYKKLVVGERIRVPILGALAFELEN